MYKKLGSWLTVLALVVFLAGIADAVRVGVVVEFPDGEIFKECISVDQNTNGYDVMEKTGLSGNITWSNPGPAGHALCAINEIGCPASNPFCKYPDYWNFYTKSGANSWTYSMLGFDGGETCNQHYCAKDGDVLGFAYGVDGTEPSDISFNDVCPPARTRDRRTKEFKVSVLPDEDELFVGEKITILIKDVSTSKGIKNAEVKITGNGVKIENKTSSSGKFSFELDNPGSYTVNLNVPGYRPLQRKLKIEVKEGIPETTTSTTSTSSTTLKVEESTTTTSPPTTSTTSTTTTTTSPPTTSTTTTTTTTSTTTTVPEAPGILGEVVAFSVENSALIFVLLILVCVGYFGYNFYKKKR